MKKIHFLISAILILSISGMAQSNILISKNLSEKSEIDDLYSPQNLSCWITDSNDVNLAWEPPGTYTNQWIHWDTGEIGWNVGLMNGGTFFVASRWTPSDLVYYHGMLLTKISFAPQEDPNAIFNLYVWTGNNAGTLVLSQPIANFTLDEWNEVILSTPVTIDAAEELWFGYSVTHEVGHDPAGCDWGPAVPYKGDMISFNGSTWLSNSVNSGQNYNWSLAGYVELSDNSAIKMIKDLTCPDLSNLYSTKGLFKKENSLEKIVPLGKKALLGYNVYRNNEIVGFTTTTNYFDENLPVGNYEYYVTALYDEGESGTSNVIEIEIPYPCGMPENIFATLVNQNVVEITFETPVTGVPLSFNVYRNDILIANINDLFYTDTPGPGTFEYCISSACLYGESELACADSVTVYYLAPPTNFQAGIFEPLFIEMSWYPPENKNLIGYNLYCAHNDTIFDSINFFPENYGYYIAEELGWFSFYVTALYDEGESQPSNTESVLVDAINEKFINKLSIFPNPTNEGISIKSDFIIKLIDLYNSFGQLITNYKVNDKMYHLNTSEFNQGIYYLKIEFRDGLVIKKIVIE